MRNGVIPRGRKNPLPFPSAPRDLPSAPELHPRKRVFKGGRNRRCLPFCSTPEDCPPTRRSVRNLAQKWRTSLPDEILHPVCRPVHRMLRLMRRVLGIPPHRRIEHRAGRYHRNHRACHRSGCNAGNKGEIRKRSTAFHKVYRISMPARPSNFTQQKNACLAQSTIYNRMFILYNISNNPPLRCGP